MTQPSGKKQPLLSNEQLVRYSRHIRLKELGVEGQRRLLDSKVLVVGAGGLGSPAAIYLAAAGVGTIGIVDGDRVDRSNLQRQILHFEADLGRPKTQSAIEHLQKINSEVEVIPHQTVLTSENALDIIRDYDVVINGCDNFPTRYLLNDACVLLGKPLVDASILRWEGQAMVFLPGRGCYRCLFPSPPPPGQVPSCAEAGIVGAVAGHMGTLQAIEAIKVLLGVGEPLASRLLVYDALAAEYDVFRWDRRTDCPVCGDHPTITELIDYEEFCGVPLPEADAESRLADDLKLYIATPAARPDSTAPAEADPATPPDLANRDSLDVSVLEAKALVDAGLADLVDVREQDEWEQEHVEGARLIPLSEFTSRVREVDRERPTLFLCHLGERSERVVRALRRAGYEKVFNVEGGMVAWHNYRLPVRTGRE